jgi:hypothetical protein
LSWDYHLGFSKKSGRLRRLTSSMKSVYKNTAATCWYSYSYTGPKIATRD